MPMITDCKPIDPAWCLHCQRLPPDAPAIHICTHCKACNKKMSLFPYSLTIWQWSFQSVFFPGTTLYNLKHSTSPIYSIMMIYFLITCNQWTVGILFLNYGVQQLRFELCLKGKQHIDRNILITWPWFEWQTNQSCCEKQHKHSLYRSVLNYRL